MCIATSLSGDWQYDPFCRRRPHRSARDSLSGGLLDVPHLPGLDGADAAAFNVGTLNLVPIANAMAHVPPRAARTTSPMTICAMRLVARCRSRKMASPFIKRDFLFPIWSRATRSFGTAM